MSAAPLARLATRKASSSQGMEIPAVSVVSDMNEQQVREFVEMLAVPAPTDPPPCPLCGEHHRLETSCVRASRNNRLEAAGLRE
jgi:hypothetical protein